MADKVIPTLDVNGLLPDRFMPSRLADTALVQLIKSVAGSSAGSGSGNNTGGGSTSSGGSISNVVTDPSDISLLVLDESVYALDGTDTDVVVVDEASALFEGDPSDANLVDVEDTFVTSQSVKSVIRSTLVAGTNVSITSTNGGDTLTIAVTGITGTGATGNYNDLTNRPPTDPTATTAGLRTLGSGAQQAAPGNDTRFITPTERSKLSGIAVGATANSPDATLLSRASHTGTQTAATISDLTEVVQDIVGALLVAGANTSLSYDDAAGKLTISATGGSGTTTLDAEAVRDTIGAALKGTGLITVTNNDAGDTITVSTTATTNSTDAFLLNRANHTGTLSADTLADGTTNKVYTTNEKTKLSGIAVGATVNATDAQLRDRATHTGTQAIATITGLKDALYGYPVQRLWTANTTVGDGWYGAVFEIDSASNISVFLPNDTTAPNYPIGHVITFTQVGTGAVTVAGQTGVILQTADSLTLRKQFSSCTARKRAENTWIIEGDLA